MQYKKIFANPFLLTGKTEDPTNVILDYTQLHVKEFSDSKGRIIRKEYYKSYDAETQIFSDLSVKEERTYVVSAQGLPISKQTVYSYYDTEGNISHITDPVVKYYTDLVKANQLNKNIRQTLVDKSGLYLYQAMLTTYGAVQGELNIDDFQAHVNSVTTMYLNHNIDPLLEKITNSTNSNHADYKSYITAQIRDTLLSILNVRFSEIE